MQFRRVGFALSWLLTVASLALAALVWIGSGSRPEGVGKTADSDETATLRLALAAARSESEALRDELDRLLDRYRETLPERSTRANGSRAPAEHAAGERKQTSTNEIDRERLAGLAARYSDALSRVAAGDEAAADEAYRAALSLVRAGPPAFPALRDAYLSTSDPRARAIMARAFLSTLGPPAREFVASQLEVEDDPEVVEELALRASHLSSPSTTPVFRDAFLDLLDRDSIATDQAKIAAIRGLRHRRTDGEVDRALLEAASDPSPEVRMAAVYELASRPGNRDRVEMLLSSERSPRVRDVAECRLLLEDLPFAR